MRVVINTARQPMFADYVLGLGVINPMDCEITSRATPSMVQGAHLIGFNLPLGISAFAAQTTNYILRFSSEHRGLELTPEDIDGMVLSCATYTIRRVS